MSRPKQVVSKPHKGHGNRCYVEKGSGQKVQSAFFFFFLDGGGCNLSRIVNREAQARLVQRPGGTEGGAMAMKGRSSGLREGPWH